MSSVKNAELKLNSTFCKKLSVTVTRLIIILIN